MWKLQNNVWYKQKYVLVKKIFTNKLNLDLPQLTCVEKTMHGGETHWLSGK